MNEAISASGYGEIRPIALLAFGRSAHFALSPSLNTAPLLPSTCSSRFRCSFIVITLNTSGLMISVSAGSQCISS